MIICKIQIYNNTLINYMTIKTRASLRFTFFDLYSTSPPIFQSFQPSTVPPLSRSKLLIRPSNALPYFLSLFCYYEGSVELHHIPNLLRFHIISLVGSSICIWSNRFACCRAGITRAVGSRCVVVGLFLPYFVEV